jgi:cytoskeletal protein CcmA (bactofilin family)
MFSKSSKSPSSASPMAATGAKNIPFSLIGGDVVINGDVSASVDLHIDGRVEGDIRCAALVQGPDSSIIGHVTAKSARLAGLVEGSITAEELIVEATARITGDVAYDRITIAAGGQIDGRFAHRTPGAQGGDLKLISNDSAA